MVGVQAHKRCYFGGGPGGRSHSLCCDRASHCLALLSNHSRLISSAWTSLLRRRASWAERSSREPICLKWHRCCFIALLPIEGSGTQLAFSSYMKATVLGLIVLWFLAGKRVLSFAGGRDLWSRAKNHARKLGSAIRNSWLRENESCRSCSKLGALLNYALAVTRFHC